MIELPDASEWNVQTCQTLWQDPVDETELLEEIKLPEAFCTDLPGAGTTGVDAAGGFHDVHQCIQKDVDRFVWSFTKAVAQQLASRSPDFFVDLAALALSSSMGPFHKPRWSSFNDFADPLLTPPGPPLPRRLQGRVVHPRHHIWETPCRTITDHGAQCTHLDFSTSRVDSTNLTTRRHTPKRRWP